MGISCVPFSILAGMAVKLVYVTMRSQIVSVIPIGRFDSMDDCSRIFGGWR